MSTLSLVTAAFLAPAALAGGAKAPDPRPAVSIAKVADKASYVPGETITYSVAVTNTGNVVMSTATVAVSDPSLPTLTPVLPLPTELAPGAVLAYTGQRIVTPADCGALTNTAKVVVTPQAPATHPKVKAVKRPTNARATTGNRHTTNSVKKNKKPPKSPPTPTPQAPIEASASVTVEVVCAINLTIAKTADQAIYLPGQTIAYTITVTNTGTRAVPTGAITLADPTLPSLTPAAPLPAELAPGASLAFTGARITTIADCGMVTNVATVAVPGDTSPTDNTATVTVSVTGGLCNPVTIVGQPTPPTTTVAVDKSGPKTAKSRGELVPYRITLTNTGSSVATNVVALDRLPSGLAAARIPKGATIKNGVVRWQIGDLAPGQSVTVGVYLVRTANRAVKICNEASVEAGNAPRAAGKTCTRFLRVAGVRRIAVVG